MKGCISVIVALSVLVPTDAAASRGLGVSFGPQNCVKLTRSSAGSCVITTDCEGIDISQTEFAFDCIGKNHFNHNTEVVRHSFGIGGFEAGEEFDTEVKCNRCAGPTGAAPPAAGKPQEPVVKKAKATPVPAQTAPKTPMAHAVPSKPKAVPKISKQAEDTPRVALHVKTAKAAAHTKSSTNSGFWPFTSSGSKEDTPSDVVKYGPKGCVSVYKSGGHCIMSTDCDKKDMVNYEFGLVCVDKTGSPVKHLFGKESFDEKETFDTLIKCDQCLGLEDIPDQVALAGEVATMGKDIANLKAVMKNISINVQMLNKEVFPKPPSAPSPAPAVGASPAAAKEEEPKEEPKEVKAKEVKKALVHHSVTRHRHRGNLRRSHRRHRHHYRDYDDDEEDDDSDRDDDEDRYDDSEADEREQPAATPQYVPLNDVEQSASTMLKTSSDDDSNEDDEGNDED